VGPFETGLQGPSRFDQTLGRAKNGRFQEEETLLRWRFYRPRKGMAHPKVYSLRMLDSRRVSDNVSGLVERQNVEMPEGVRVRQRVGLVKKRIGPNGRNAILDALIGKRDCVGSFCRA
jgi:hypothetical protein